MTTQFDISALGLTVTEGGVYSFTLTPKAALGSDTVIRWEIVPKGELPIFSSDFSALSGVVNFASGATDAQTVTLTPSDDSVLEVLKHFELRVYEVVGARDDTSSETDDILIGSQDVTLSDDETDDYGGSLLVSTTEANILTAGNTQDLNLIGAGGDDNYVITRFQHGDIDISDALGANLIKFDAGVTITGYSESSSLVFGFLTVIESVSLTLSTGAVVRITSPAGKFSYQLGDGEALSYADFKTAIGASGTNETSALATDYTITTATAVPDISGNTGSVPTETLVTTIHSDVIGMGGDVDFSAIGAGGDDVYVITRFQHGDIDISDALGANLIKFDVGVSITGYSESSSLVFGFLTVIESVSLTLSTGAVVSITSPGGKFSYQLGDGETLDYDAFKTAIGASGTNADSALAADYTVTAPQVPTEEPEANNAPTVATEIPDQTATEDTAFSLDISSVFADADGDTLTYSISGNPSWLTLTGTTLSGTPVQSDTGTHSISITADDGNGGTVTETFTLTVENVDDAPVFEGVKATHLVVINGVEFTYLGDELPEGFFIRVDNTSSTGQISPDTHNGATGIKIFMDSVTRQQIVDIINQDIAPGTILTSFNGYPINYSRDSRPDNDGDSNPDPIIKAVLVDPATGDERFNRGGGGTIDNPPYLFITVDRATTEITLDENTDAADVVFTATATDADNIAGETATDTITYELVAGAGDSDFFTIDANTGEVRFAATPDYETQGRYVVHVKATSVSTVGEGYTTTATAQYVVNLNNLSDTDPVVATEILDQTVDEGTDFTFTFDEAAFTDADGEVLTYEAALADGSPLPDWLTFDADTRTFSGEPDRSDVGTLNIVVTATDPSGANITDSFDLTVNYVDAAPVFEGVERSVTIAGIKFIYTGEHADFIVSPSHSSSQAEHFVSPFNDEFTTVRIASSHRNLTLQDIVDLVNDNPAAASFAGHRNDLTSEQKALIRAELVDPNSGSDALDYAAFFGGDGNYGSTTDYAIANFVLDDISLDENSDTNTVVFTATATDPDNIAGQTATDTITYELVSGAGDSDLFTIDSATGEVRFINTPDYETQASYVVHVKAVSTSTLGTGSTTETTAQYTVNLNNLNDNGPEFTDNVEPYGLTLGGIRFIYTGHDAAEAASFSMRFELNTNLVLHDINPLDSGASIRVSKTDLTQQQIVDLVNANFAARGIPGYTDRRSDAERNLLRAELVDPSTGGDALDYTALFGGTSHLSEATHNFVKQPPSITIDENTETYEVVFTAQATDADNVAGQTPTDTITYDLVLGAGDNSYFTIDRTTGEVRFKDTPDYETKASYEVHVVAHSPSTLGAGSGGAIPQETTKQYIIRLNDTDDPPVFDVENTAGATEIDYEYSLVIQGVRLTYVGDSDQVDQNFVFDISRNFDLRTFIIDISGSSLILQARTFSADMTLQEFVNLINLGTTITGPGGTDDQRSSAESGLVHAEVIDPSKADVLFDFIAAVNNPGRRFPEGRKSYAFGQDKIVVVKEAVTLDENSDVANVLFTPTATDINTGDTIHYELVGVGKHDNDFFTIDRDTGAVRFAATPDYETQSSYEVYVKAVSTTTAGSTTESVIKYVVELNDVNDAPVFANPLDTQTVTSGQPFSFTVEAATDDEGDSITYEATQADGTDLPSWLSFDVDTRTFSGTPPRKASTDLTIRITATDSNGAVGTQDFELKLDRAPIFDIERQAGKTADVEGADYVEAVDVISWDENDTDVLLTATATDINVGDVIHYELDNSITGNDNSFFTIDRDTGAVRFTADPDYETQTSYELYVKAVSTNEAGGTTQSIIKYTVELNNLDDNAPEFIDSEYSVTVAGIKFTYLGDGVPTIDLRFTLSQGTSGWSAYVSGDGNPSIFYDGFYPTRNLTLQHIIDVTSGDAEFSALVRAELAVPDTGSNRLDYDEFFGGTGYRVTKTHSFGQESITWEENSAVDGVVFTATATDADNEEGQTPTDTITYELVSGQGDNSFFSIDSATGDVRFLATPDYETQASYVVHVKAISTSTIGTGSTQETIRQYTVNLSDAVRQINVHGLLFKTTNEQAVDISFELTSLSSITTYDLATNRLTLKFNGTPTLNSIISHLSSTTDFRTNGWTVELAAGADGTTRLNFNDDDNDPTTIEVKDTVYTLPAFGATPEPPNNAPTVATEIPDQTASEGTDFTFTFDEASFADADGDTLTYTAALADGSDLPDWLTFDADTRTFSSTRTLTQSDAGTLSITVTATDPDGEAVTDTFTLTVENIDNNAPVFTNADDFSVTIAGLKFTYTGADVSQVDSFLFNVGYISNANAPSHGISYSSGSIIVVTSHANLTLQDIVDLVNANAAAESITGFSDRRSAEQKTLIRAELVDPSTGGTALDYDAFFGTQSVGLIIQTFESSHVMTKTFTEWDENSDAADVVFTATAEDADNIAGQTPTETITYELVSGMGDNDFFTIDANTGEVRFAATPDYETQSGYTLHIKATSTSTLGGGGTQETTARYWVNLNNLNDNTPIVATEIADQTATEGTAFTFTFDADAFTDADGDTLTYSVAGNPSWLSFDADTRTFSGTPPEGSQGTVSVTVTASDGTDTVTDSFDIEITAAPNNAPIVATEIADQTATEGTDFTFTFDVGVFTDADGDTLTYSVAGNPSWLSFDADTRTFSGTPPEGSQGTVSVTVTASDGTDTVTDSFDITIAAPVAPAEPETREVNIHGLVFSTTDETMAEVHIIATGYSSVVYHSPAGRLWVWLNLNADLSDTLNDIVTSLNNQFSSQSINGVTVRLADDADGTHKLNFGADDNDDSTIEVASTTSTHSFPTDRSSEELDTPREINIHGLLFKTTNAGAADILFVVDDSRGALNYNSHTGRLTIALPGLQTLNQIISFVESDADFADNHFTVELADGADGGTRFNFRDDDGNADTIEVKDTVHTIPAAGAEPPAEPPAEPETREINVHGLLFKTTNADAVSVLLDTSTSSGAVFYDSNILKLYLPADDDNVTDDTLNGIINYLNGHDALTDNGWTVELADGADGTHKLNFGADDGDPTTIEARKVSTFTLPTPVTAPAAPSDDNAPVFETSADSMAAYSVVIQGIEFAYTGDNYPATGFFVATKSTSTNHYLAHVTRGDQTGLRLSFSFDSYPTRQQVIDMVNGDLTGALGRNAIREWRPDGVRFITARLVESGTGDQNFVPAGGSETLNQLVASGISWDENSDVNDIVFTATATDADNIAGQTPTETITYELVANMGDNAFFTIDTNTGAVRFAATPDYETQTSYEVHVKAISTSTLGTGSTKEATAQYTVQLNNLNDNAPTVATAIPDQEATEGTAFTFAFDADAFTDADGDTLTYSVSGNPSWLSFDADTRTFSGTPPEGSQGTVSVTVTASDGTHTVTDTFDIEIAAAGNTRPTVTETAVTIEVARGATLALTDLADDIGWSDPDPDDSVFSYFKIDFGGNHILGGGFYLDGTQQTTADLEALTSGDVEFRAGNKNGAPFTFTLQVGDGGESGTDATDLLPAITVTLDVV